ncbi:MAG: hypothetical protein GYA15_04590 [Leptolinea sp.]|nr:hypothetical protein [Leptolinea sp.]
MSVQIIKRIISKNRRYSSGLIILSATAGFLAGFLIPLRLSLPLRYDFLLPLITTVLLLWAVWKLPQPFNKAASIFITMILFTGALAAQWRMGINGVYEVFGLLPWFDAQGYYSEATKLLDGGTFSDIASRRPLFTGFFSVLLAITGRNLRMTLAILTGLGGLVTWLLAGEIHRSEKSSLLPSLVTCGMFFFYRNFTGDVLSENLGFFLGSLGLLLLWRSAIHQKYSLALWGLFSFCLALVARPGAVLALPFLLVWILFPAGSRRSLLFKGLSSTGVIVSALLLNHLLTAVLAPGTSASFSNFAYSFYGFAEGGAGWTEIYRDHPEVFTTGNQQEIADKIYRISLQTLREHPENAISACQHAYGTFFSTGYYSAFNYFGTFTTPHTVNLDSAPVEYGIRTTVLFLWILFFPAAWIKRKDRRYSLLVALNFGLLISLPFAPPTDAEHMRAYAASIPSMLLTVGLPLNIFNKDRDVDFAYQEEYSTGILSFTVILLCAVIFGPLILRVTTPGLSLPKTSCPNGLDAVVARISPGSFVSIGQDPEDPFGIPYARFQKNLDQFPSAVIGQKLKSVPENSKISQQNNILGDNDPFWLVSPAQGFPVINRPAVYCGRWSDDPRLDFVFFASRVLP